MKLFRCFVSILSLLMAPVGWAGTNGFVVPPFRGTAQSQAGYWETFTVPVGGAGNLPDKPGATSSARLIQHQTNAFLTGSGNIYNLDGTSAFSLTNSAPFAVGTVVLQTRTLGTELDYASAWLTFSNASGVHVVAPRPRVELNRGNQPGLGATVSSLWEWSLAGSNVTEFVLTFQAAGPSTSFDALTLDTTTNTAPLFARPFVVDDTAPAIERWMYPFNGAPCDRPTGSAFGTFGDEAGVDTRHAQHLVGWDTGGIIATNRGATNYVVTRARVTLTINRGDLFAYDPTQDDFRTYFPTNDPVRLPDGDTGRPIELFGVGYRHGYTAATFDQCAPFGTNGIGTRNAYAAGWSTNGVLVDVGNNVGKTNPATPPFEVKPFALGLTTNVAPGQLVPAGAKVTFDLNLNDPFVLAYLQSALDSGHLRLMVTALHESGGQFGGPNYPDFVTHFNEVIPNPTRLELEGVILGGGDLDADGLPDDWEVWHFSGLTASGTADPDGDRMTNLAEWRAGTRPSDAASVLQLSPLAPPAAVSTLRVSHAAHRTYTVEYTGNFQSWLPLTNAPVFNLSEGTATWQDTSGAGTNRFYRVRLGQ